MTEHASDHTEAIDTLVGEAHGLEHGPAKVALLEEAVRLADTCGDVKAGFRTRLALIEAATFGARPDVALVAFSWCLAQSDRAPEQFPESPLLWKYKWVVGDLPNFPQVSQRQVAAALDDMERRFARHGSTGHAVHQLRRDVVMAMGDRQAARQAHARLSTVRRDWLSDCPACVQDREVDYQAFCGRHAVAVRKAADILSGRVRCVDVPQRTYAGLLLPLFLLGRLDQAMECHQKGYRLVARKPRLLLQVAEHMLFLGLTDNPPRAVQLVEKHLPSALATPDLSWRYEFLRAARFVLERFHDHGKQSVKLRLPPTVPLDHAAGRYAVAELARWTADQANELAARFDARNGNAWFSDRLAELAKLTKRVRPYPLPTVRPSKGQAGDR